MAVPRSTKQLQKEHPCDDYYRQLYLEEKQSRRKKNEEKAIKKWEAQKLEKIKKVRKEDIEVIGQRTMQSFFALVGALEDQEANGTDSEMDLDEKADTDETDEI